MSLNLVSGAENQADLAALLSMDTAEDITEAPVAKEASAAASENSHELSQTDAASDAASASREAALMARMELLELRCKVSGRQHMRRDPRCAPPLL